jgi:hypothetical protein
MVPVRPAAALNNNTSFQLNNNTSFQLNNNTSFQLNNNTSFHQRRLVLKITFAGLAVHSYDVAVAAGQPEGLECWPQYGCK